MAAAAIFVLPPPPPPPSPQPLYYSSSSSLNRYVLQYTKLNNANTRGNVMREMTSIRFDLEHFLREIVLIHVLKSRSLCGGRFEIVKDNHRGRHNLNACTCEDKKQGNMIIYQFIDSWMCCDRCTQIFRVRCNIRNQTVYFRNVENYKVFV